MRLFDVLGPVMIGPSSSHTAGAARIGYTAQKLLGDVPAEADIGLYGSFATTGRGHGTDRALVAGLLGLRPDDPRLPDSFALAEQAGMKFTIHPVELRAAHPNTAVLTLKSKAGRTLVLKAASVGGGRIRVTEIDGVPADFGGDSNTLIIHNEDTPGCIAEVTMSLAQRRINLVVTDSAKDLLARHGYDPVFGARPLKRVIQREVADRLAQGGIAVRAGLHCAPLAHQSGGTGRTGTVRVSFSAFNSQKEVERFVRVLRQMA